MSKKSVKMSISLDAGLVAELEAFAKESGKSKSGVIAEALEYYFDFLDLALAEKRLNDNSKFVSADEVAAFVESLER